MPNFLSTARTFRHALERRFVRRSRAFRTAVAPHPDGGPPLRAQQAARLVGALAVVATASAVCAEASATPPRLHVRGTSRIEARAELESSTPTWRVGLRGVLLDDASDPISGQPLMVELHPTSQTAVTSARFVDCSSGRDNEPPPFTSRATTKTGDAGRFCLELRDWPTPPEGQRVGITYSGNADYDPSTALVGVDRIRRVVALDFVPPPKRLALEKSVHTLRVQTAVEPPYAPQEHADPIELELLLRGYDALEASKQRLLARTTTSAGQSTSFELRGTDLGRAGPATLVLRARPGPTLSATERTARILRTASVSLSMKHAPVVEGPTAPLTLNVEARAGGNPVPDGAVEVAFGPTSLTAPVRAGLARPVLRLGVPRGGRAAVTVRYLPGSPWWESGSGLQLEIRVPPANPWSQAPWIIAAGLVVLWLARSWWRPRPATQPVENRLKRVVTGRPAVDVVGRCTDDGSWTGTVVDAHEGVPLADVTVTASWPAFLGHSTEHSVVTDPTGAFKLQGNGPGTSEGATLEVRSRSHARLRRPLPPPGNLRIALVSRRRALLDALVRWARRRGHPWWRRGEPTPGQVAREARLQAATSTAVWAEAIQTAAFGPNPPLEGQDEALTEPRARELGTTDPLEGIEQETPFGATRR